MLLCTEFNSEFISEFISEKWWQEAQLKTAASICVDWIRLSDDTPTMCTSGTFCHLWNLYLDQKMAEISSLQDILLPLIISLVISLSRSHTFLLCWRSQREKKWEQKKWKQIIAIWSQFSCVCFFLLHRDNRVCRDPPASIVSSLLSSVLSNSLPFPVYLFASPPTSKTPPQILARWFFLFPYPQFDKY